MRVISWIGCSTPLRSPKTNYTLAKRLLFVRNSSDFSHLEHEMKSRQLPIRSEAITMQPSSLLQTTLSEFLPFPITGVSPSYLPFGFHVVHFPTNVHLSALLPDGTDALQSPGLPFTRRMWAGGSLTFGRPIPLRNSPFLCKERIADVLVKGQGTDEKVFVTIERVIFPKRPPVGKRDAGGIFHRHLLETRTLVFMREDRQKPAAGTITSPSKVLKPMQSPDFSHTILPTAPLLFRFSALTFNAHAIHFDKQYCRDVEGHRNLLVHGPLSMILMLHTLCNYLRVEVRDEGREIIRSLQYRNLAPLYAEEEMKVCIKRKKEASRFGSWDVWIENSDGGLCVKATVKTTRKSAKVPSTEGGSTVQEAVEEQDVTFPAGGIDLKTKRESAAEAFIADEAMPHNTPTPSEDHGSEVEHLPKEEAEAEAFIADETMPHNTPTPSEDHGSEDHGSEVEYLPKEEAEAEEGNSPDFQR